VVQAASEAGELFERLGQTLGRIIAAQNLAEAYLYLDDLTEAERHAQRVIQSRTPHILPDGLRTLGEIKLAQGDQAAAETLIRQSLEQAQANEDRYLEAYGWRALARVQAACAQQPASQASLEKAIELFETLGLDQEVARSHSTRAQLLA
jgi:tetratricopeptide (TPR) repeat protein